MNSEKATPSSPVNSVVMRRLRKQPRCRRNDWNMDLEPDDRVFDSRPVSEGAWMYDLRESKGRNKRDSGELTPVLVKKNGKPRLAALCDDGNWYWVD